MIRIDAKLAIGGAIMIIVGIYLSMYLDSTAPVGMHGMTNDEIDELLFNQMISKDIGNLVAILLGIGMLLLLLSLGTKISKRSIKSKDKSDKKDV